MSSLSTLVLALLVAQTSWRLEAKNESPDVKEVYETIRSHLGGMSEEEFNRRAVRGLLAALGPEVSLVSNGEESATASEVSLLIQTNLFDGDIAYLRVGRVEEGLSKTLAKAYAKIESTNKLRGVVVDLRYSAGGDYSAAAATAELFVSKSRPLLDWGNGVVKSREKKDAISAPVAVLVNRETSGAAEALAAIMRQTGAGLILGNKTAGQAMITQEFPLRNGDRLRIGTAPVKLGDGTELSGKGVAPDIAVDVTRDDERAYYADAFRAIPRGNLIASPIISLTNGPSGTNRTARRMRFNEAELVRERKGGETLDTELAAVREAELEGPLVHDPVLARALDVLKGLAVVRRTRS